MRLEKTIKFEFREVVNRDISWNDAIKYAKDRGMRLPTRAESLVLIENKDTLTNLPDFWWTCECTDNGEFAWYVDKNGRIAFEPLTLELGTKVVLVTDI